MPRMSETEGTFHSVSIEPGSVTRRERRELRRAGQRAGKHLAKQWAGQAVSKALDGLPGLTFPRGGRRVARNMRGRMLLRRPGWNRTSSWTFASAYPWVSSSGLGTRQCFVGFLADGRGKKASGSMWTMDPWECYEQGLITGMACVLIGTIGTGKSTTVKTWVMNLVMAGRRAMIMSDIKDEWGPVARALCPADVNPVMTVGGSHVINPLDPGRRPRTGAVVDPDTGESLLESAGEDWGEDLVIAPMSDEHWVKAVRSRRQSILRTITEILAGRRLTGDERAALIDGIDAAVSAKGEDVASMTPDTTPQVAAAASITIPDVIHALRHPSAETLEESGSASREVANQLKDMVKGDLAGLFDGPSTVEFRDDVPISVFNTKPLMALPPEARLIASQCIQSWAESVITNGDVQRVVVYEEGWENLGDIASLKRMVTQWKLARAFGIFCILILHKLSDLHQAGDEGSKARALAMSLLADADIRVIHRQKSDQLEATAELLRLTGPEREVMGRLPKGQALWKVAELEGRVVRTHRSELQASLFDTDSAMKQRTRVAA